MHIEPLHRKEIPFQISPRNTLHTYVPVPTQLIPDESRLTPNQYLAELCLDGLEEEWKQDMGNHAARMGKGWKEQFHYDYFKQLSFNFRVQKGEWGSFAFTLGEEALMLSPGPAPVHVLNYVNPNGSLLTARQNSKEQGNYLHVAFAGCITGGKATFLMSRKKMEAYTSKKTPIGIERDGKLETVMDTLWVTEAGNVLPCLLVRNFGVRYVNKLIEQYTS